jgi:hypothetical protein
MSGKRKAQKDKAEAPELGESEVKRDALGRILPGHTINPGGVSKEKRAFLERLKEDDPQTIYEAFMKGVRDGVPPIVIRAVEYLAGKPKESVEVKAEVETTAKGEAPSVVFTVTPERLSRVTAVLLNAGAVPVAPDVAPAESEKSK